MVVPNWRLLQTNCFSQWQANKQCQVKPKQLLVRTAKTHRSRPLFFVFMQSFKSYLCCLLSTSWACLFSTNRGISGCGPHCTTAEQRKTTKASDNFVTLQKKTIIAKRDEYYFKTRELILTAEAPSNKITLLLRCSLALWVVYCFKFAALKCQIKKQISQLVTTKQFRDSF